jgi:hypothetical protein
MESFFVGTFLRHAGAGYLGKAVDVRRHRVTYADDPGGSSLEVTAMDATHVMNMIEKVMPWPNMPDAAIASAIFGQYALIPQVDPTTPVLIEPEGQTTQPSTSR